MKRLLALFLIVCTTACTISYKFNGASIDYNTTKTITINDFPIRAALVYPPLATTFNETLKDAYTRQTRLTVTVRVRYTDTKKPSNDLDRTFSAYRDFSSTRMLTDVQDELISEITQELADLIFNATVGNW